MGVASGSLPRSCGHHLSISCSHRSSFSDSRLVRHRRATVDRADVVFYSRLGQSKKIKINHLLRLLGCGRCLEYRTSPERSSYTMMSFSCFILTLLCLQVDGVEGKSETQNWGCPDTTVSLQIQDQYFYLEYQPISNNKSLFCSASC